MFNCPKYQCYLSQTIARGERRIRVIEFLVDTPHYFDKKSIGILMEKFTIKVTDKGVVVIGEKGDRLEFSAGEALMVLDILKNEEVELRKMAEAASPLPLNINV